MNCLRNFILFFDRLLYETKRKYAMRRIDYITI